MQLQTNWSTITRLFQANLIVKCGETLQDATVLCVRMTTSVAQDAVADLSPSLTTAVFLLLVTTVPEVILPPCY